MRSLHHHISSRPLPWLLAMVLLAPCVASAQEEEGEAAGAERASLSGVYELAEPHAEAQQRLHAAIDRAADQVPFFLRGFARSRLREKNPVHRRIRVRVDGNTIAVAYENDRYETQEGQWTTVTAVGEPTQLLQQIVGRRIYQTFRTDEGTKQMVLTPSDDGRYLWLDVTVTSDRLPDPLRYRLRFRRTS